MKDRVLRGGSYYGAAWILRTSDRYWLGPERRTGNRGFRIVVVRRKP